MSWIFQWVALISLSQCNIGKANIYNTSYINILLSALASNEEAWQETRDVHGIMPHVFPSDDVVWATAATRDSTTWMHIDDHGLATVVTVKAGLKYWVLAVPKKGRYNTNPNGDPGSIRAFGKGWSPSGACEMLWDHEGVLLGPGDIL
jgi:hypothetical protein